MNRRVLIVLTAAVAAAVAAFGAGLSFGSGARDAAPLATPASATALQNAYERVVKTVSPAVVQIETASGLGSGIVLDRQGDIVTNAHVVGSARSFAVTFSDGRRVTGSLVGSYPANDLAVIKVAGAGVTPAVFADSSKVRVGQLA